MPTILQFKRYANTALATITGANGELIIDETNKTITVHDGSTAGGSRLATEEYVETKTTNAGVSANLVSGEYTASLSSANGSLTIPENLNLSTGVLSTNYFGPGVAISANSSQGANYNILNFANQYYYNLGDIYLSSGGGANTVFAAIDTNDGTVQHTYLFGVDGSLTLPNTLIFADGTKNYGSTVIAPSNYDIQSIANTYIQSSAAAGAKTWNFDSFGELIFPDNTIQTTAWQGSTSTLVNENNTVSLSTGGSLTLPGNIIAVQNLNITTPNGVPISVSNWNGQGGWNQGYYTNLSTTGGSGTGLTVDVAAGGAGYINITAITIHTPGTGYTNGDVITINNENNLPGTFTVVVGVNDWKFSTNSSITFPDNTIQTTAFTGYATDNTARAIAQAAYNQSNTESSFAFANAAFNQANAAFIKANTFIGYATDNTARTTANSALSNTIVLQGEINSANANISILFGIEATQNAAISAAYNFANTLALYTSGVATSQNTAIAASAQTIPQNAQSVTYTLQSSDAGKHLYYTNGSAVNLYIPWTSNTSYANGTTITIISHTSSNVTVTPNTGVTMYLAGNTTSASRNVTTYGMATLIMTAANTWYINGSGVF